ncbi:MAG: stage III sporulation protein AF [Syntrophomonas sp.]|uniref:stage III sporulation protein AF n=1 Tax=Syntrophomonas sp. TaxID=2053627 RepID=UPI002603866A|nr:stage III sporulation protein AF [Syntrophomonas sp.]MDD2510243.1 stage III sporulation protein AF [Syntrophomonas sp.]MDD3878801.1 stage III sporulation protein AF [Syntrophomonas sp.]MDD4626827.1 stage III sporulation protein AF [Syntrophomonas sp.]
MQVLQEIVRNVLVIIILTSFLELLLPEGGVRPFVRFAVGMFIVIAVLNPVLSLLFNEQELKLNLWDYRLEEGKSEEIIHNGKQIQQEIISEHNNMARDKLQGQIDAVAVLVPGVEKVKSRIEIGENGELQTINIFLQSASPEAKKEEEGIQVFSGENSNLSPEEKKLIEDKVVNIISNFYGLSTTQIEVEFEGG